MTDLTHTLFPNYVVDTESGQSDGTGENFRYSVTDKKSGDKFDTPFIQVSPDELQTPDGLFYKAPSAGRAFNHTKG